MPDQPRFIGLDLGGTNVQGGIVTAEGEVLARDKTKTKAEEGAEEVLKRIDKLVGKLLDKADLKRQHITALGIGAPGPIDPDRGVVINAVNLRWRDYPLAEKLSDMLEMPIYVDNDVNVGAWGEHKAGAGRGYDDLMGIFVGTGIGAGLVFNGSLYHGRCRTAGEVGHTVIQADGPLGLRTLENFASRTAIANRIQQLIQSNHTSMLADKVAPGEKLKSKLLAEAWEQEDALAREVISDAARHVGVAIANAVTLLSLPCVVVGGGVTEALGEPWMEMIRSSFREHVFPAELAETQLVASELEDDAGVVGAALLARRHANVPEPAAT